MCSECEAKTRVAAYLSACVVWLWIHDMCPPIHYEILINEYEYDFSILNLNPTIILIVLIIEQMHLIVT